MTKHDFKLLEKELSYDFEDINLLDLALTHSSYANEYGNNKNYFNERIEFLGDSILNLAVSEKLYHLYPNEPEGSLTKLRSGLVCEETLAKIGRCFSLGKFLKLGKGESKTGGRNRASILADTVEAVCGAVFLDSNYETAQKFIYRLFSQTGIEFVKQDSIVNYKSALQNHFSKHDEVLSYKLLKTEGPDHDPVFYMAVYYKDKPIGYGVGKNKKSAEQVAAKDALEKINE